ncbi:MAG: hypothetical protein OYH77_03545 [Pseudomonadota bacterium]|nr:hypothetical protein [Pseudomonadota bacterium]
MNPHRIKKIPLLTYKTKFIADTSEASLAVSNTSVPLASTA